jgi:hypothetical protein
MPARGKAVSDGPFARVIGEARRLSKTFLGGFVRFQGLARGTSGAPVVNAPDFRESRLKMDVNRKISMAKSIYRKNRKHKLPFDSLRGRTREKALCHAALSEQEERCHPSR